MHILITGAEGFIGGRLAEYFHQSGHHIILNSRNLTEPPKWLPSAKVVGINWDDNKSLELSCSGANVVIHAAGMNSRDCSSNPEAALAFNGLATSRLVSAAARSSVENFIYLSTAHVYRSPLTGKITEETPAQNQHPYATSHFAGEQAVLNLGKPLEMKRIVLRLSNVFGVPMHKKVNCWMLLVNNLCKQAVQKKKLLLETSGLKQRDFISMMDVCNTIEYLALKKFSSSYREVLNVGSGVSKPVIDMAKLIQWRCKVVLNFEPLLEIRKGDEDTENSKLDFRVDKLNSLGIAFNKLNSKVEEIDRLLIYCQLEFSNK